jgi:hypothetical protein
MLAFECVVGAILGQSFDSAPRIAASLVLGPAVLAQSFVLTGPVIVGIGLFVVLGGVYGMAAAYALTRIRPVLSGSRLLIAGSLFGALVWVINCLTIGPLLFPQAVVLDFVWQGLVAHAGVFGPALAAQLAQVEPQQG